MKQHGYRKFLLKYPQEQNFSEQRLIVQADNIKLEKILKIIYIVLYQQTSLKQGVITQLFVYPTPHIVVQGVMSWYSSL